MGDHSPPQRRAITRRHAPRSLGRSCTAVRPFAGGAPRRRTTLTGPLVHRRAAARRRGATDDLSLRDLSPRDLSPPRARSGNRSSPPRERSPRDRSPCVRSPSPHDELPPWGGRNHTPSCRLLVRSPTRGRSRGHWQLRRLRDYGHSLTRRRVAERRVITRTPRSRPPPTAESHGAFTNNGFSSPPRSGEKRRLLRRHVTTVLTCGRASGDINGVTGGGVGACHARLDPTLSVQYPRISSWTSQLGGGR